MEILIFTGESLLPRETAAVCGLHRHRGNTLVIVDLVFRVISVELMQVDRNTQLCLRWIFYRWVFTQEGGYWNDADRTAW